MYFVNSRREAGLMLPDQPPAVSAVEAILQEQVIPSFFAMRERASGAVTAYAPPPLTDQPEELPELVGPERPEAPGEAGEEEEEDEIINGMIARGDSAKDILAPYLPPDSVQQVLDVTKKVHPLTRLRSGHPYTVVRSADGGGMERFEYEIDDRRQLVVTRTENGFLAQVEPIVYEHVLVRVEGTIRSSLFETLASAGESPILAVRISDILGSEINFIRDIQDGDRFSLIIEKRFRGTVFKGYGRLLGLSFVNQGKKYEAFLYPTETGEAYFNARGESLKKTLLKSPLSFTRISSGYSMNRKHPIFHDHRAHQGVDYAAPTGTPVKAVGSGTVDMAGWGNGYGNMVVLRHPGGLESMYSHLSRFSPLAKKGTRVRQGQVIGYVGSTGYATGPHLDFRLRKNGTFINPSKISSQRGEGISRRHMAEFKRRKAIVEACLQGKRDVSDCVW